MPTTHVIPPAQQHGGEFSNLQPCGDFTAKQILGMQPCLQKEFLLAHCYSAYVYTDAAKAPGGSLWDGCEDGRYFLIQPALRPEQWGVYEYVRIEHEGQRRYFGRQVFLLSETDLWDRIRKEGFLLKFEELHVTPTLADQSLHLELRTHLRHYGPGPAAHVLIEAILDTKWLNDPPE